MDQSGVNVLALLKGGERYVFLYDDTSAGELLKTLGQYASDPELDFNWYDAAVLSQRVHQHRLDEAHADLGPHASVKHRSRLPE